MTVVGSWYAKSAPWFAYLTLAWIRLLNFHVYSAIELQKFPIAETHCGMPLQGQQSVIIQLCLDSLTIPDASVFIGYATVQSL